MIERFVTVCVKVGLLETHLPKDATICTCVIIDRKVGEGVCLCVCNQWAYADNCANAVDWRFIFFVILGLIMKHYLNSNVQT